MDGIYKITLVGIAVTSALACWAAKVLSAEAGTKNDPIVLGTDINKTECFSRIKDATIEDEGAMYSGEAWLTADGQVNHPEWFEGDKLLNADGTYYLVKAKEAPEYYRVGSTDFSDTLDIGDIESENCNLFSAVRASEPQVRNVGGNEYTYRTLGKNGAMVLNLQCDPERANYLTVRLWGGDTGDTSLWICDPVSGNMNETDSTQPHSNAGVVDRRDWVGLNSCASSPQYDGGFVYATYLIPKIYTEGRSSVSLRLYSTGGPANYSSVLIKDQTEESRGIYDVYMTQEAEFDPADHGIVDGGYSGNVGSLYSISDSGAMDAQSQGLKTAVLKGIECLRSWQIYGEEAPSWMHGMITRTDWRADIPESDEEWKNRFYNSNFMLRQNLTPLNMLELATYSYHNAAELGLSDDEKEEMLDRAVAGIDFLCRAQGVNGGFYSEQWIGGPQREKAGGNNLTGFGLRSAGKCITEIYGALDESILNEMIDSDADGTADKPRNEAWISMLEAARDYLLDVDGGYGHAPNQDMANSIAALRFDEAIGLLGGSTMSKSRAGAVLDRCFGFSKNPVTSSYWVSPEGTILENFGSVQGGYSGDYGSNAVAELSQLAQLAYDNYGFSYNKYMKNFYNAVSQYYFTGKKLLNGEFVPQEYTEGIISNRNTYYPGTERYPIDIYSALELENDTALKIIVNYLTQKNITELINNGQELDPSNVHFEDNVLDAAYLYLRFDEIIDAANVRAIENYSFPLDDETIDSYVWADEMARNVVIKDHGEKIFMALNWRSPAYSTTIYSPGKQSIRANNLCRVHAVNESYDSYGYASMNTDGYKDWTEISESDGCMEALMTVKYGSYTIIMNSYNCGGNGTAKDFDASAFEETAGLDRGMSYMDMFTGDIYSYGNGYWHSSGKIMRSSADSTLVLKELSISASQPVISNGEAFSVLYNNTDVGTDAVMYAAEYDEYGRLSDVRSKNVNAEPGRTQIRLEAGNAQKAFIWSDKAEPVKLR